jgi:hypothetical protein
MLLLTRTDERAAHQPDADRGVHYRGADPVADLTIILTLKTPVLVWIVRGYITLFTGTPLLVQIFLIYYGPASSRRCRSIRLSGICSLSRGCVP